MIDVDFIDREYSGFAAANGFRWIPLLPDLTERYRAGGTDLFYRLDGHLNSEGNAFVGSSLYTKFREWRLAPLN